MTRRTFLRVAGPVLALLVPVAIAPAAEPFHGFFQPRGGALYSPLHYHAPVLYKLKYHCHGPECCGTRVSVYPPPRPASLWYSPPPKPVEKPADKSAPAPR